MMRPFRESSRKAASMLPEHARYKFLLEAAQACCGTAPEFAAIIGQAALKFADKAALKLPRGHEFCSRCGVAFAPDTCLRLEVHDASMRGGSSKQLRRCDAVLNRAVVVFVCKVCGYDSRLPCHTWQSALSLATRTATRLDTTCYVHLSPQAAREKAQKMALTDARVVVGRTPKIAPVPTPELMSTPAPAPVSELTQIPAPVQVPTPESTAFEAQVSSTAATALVPAPKTNPAQVYAPVPAAMIATSSSPAMQLVQQERLAASRPNAGDACVGDAQLMQIPTTPQPPLPTPLSLLPQLLPCSQPSSTPSHAPLQPPSLPPSQLPSHPASQPAPQPPLDPASQSPSKAASQPQVELHSQPLSRPQILDKNRTVAVHTAQPHPEIPALVPHTDQTLCCTALDRVTAFSAAGCTVAESRSVPLPHLTAVLLDGQAVLTSCASHAACDSSVHESKPATCHLCQRAAGQPAGCANDSYTYATIHNAEGVAAADGMEAAVGQDVHASLVAQADRVETLTVSAHMTGSLQPETTCAYEDSMEDVHRPDAVEDSSAAVCAAGTVSGELLRIAGKLTVAEAAAITSNDAVAGQRALQTNLLHSVGTDVTGLLADATASASGITGAEVMTVSIARPAGFEGVLPGTARTADDELAAVIVQDATATSETATVKDTITTTRNATGQATIGTYENAIAKDVIAKSVNAIVKVAAAAIGNAIVNDRFATFENAVVRDATATSEIGIVKDTVATFEDAYVWPAFPYQRAAAPCKQRHPAQQAIVDIANHDDGPDILTESMDHMGMQCTIRTTGNGEPVAAGIRRDAVHAAPTKSSTSEGVGYDFAHMDAMSNDVAVACVSTVEYDTVKAGHGPSTEDEVAGAAAAPTDCQSGMALVNSAAAAMGWRAEGPAAALSSEALVRCRGLENISASENKAIGNVKQLLARGEVASEPVVVESGKAAIGANIIQALIDFQMDSQPPPATTESTMDAVDAVYTVCAQDILEAEFVKVSTTAEPAECAELANRDPLMSEATCAIEAAGTTKAAMTTGAACANPAAVHLQTPTVQRGTHSSFCAAAEVHQTVVVLDAPPQGMQGAIDAPLVCGTNVQPVRQVVGGAEAAEIEAAVTTSITPAGAVYAAAVTNVGRPRRPSPELRHSTAARGTSAGHVAVCAEHIKPAKPQTAAAGLPGHAELQRHGSHIQPDTLALCTTATLPALQPGLERASTILAEDLVTGGQVMEVPINGHNAPAEVIEATSQLSRRKKRKLQAEQQKAARQNLSVSLVKPDVAASNTMHPVSVAAAAAAQRGVRLEAWQPRCNISQAGMPAEGAGQQHPEHVKPMFTHSTAAAGPHDDTAEQQVGVLAAELGSFKQLVHVLHSAQSGKRRRAADGLVHDWAAAHLARVPNQRLRLEERSALTADHEPSCRESTAYMPDTGAGTQRVPEGFSTRNVNNGSTRLVTEHPGAEGAHGTDLHESRHSAAVTSMPNHGEMRAEGPSALRNDCAAPEVPAKAKKKCVRFKSVLPPPAVQPFLQRSTASHGRDALRSSSQQPLIEGSSCITLQLNTAGTGLVPDWRALRLLCRHLPMDLVVSTAALATGQNSVGALGHPKWRHKHLASVQDGGLAQWSHAVAARVQPLHPEAAKAVANVEDVLFLAGLKQLPTRAGG